MPKVFISYLRKDIDFAHNLAAADIDTNVDAN